MPNFCTVCLKNSVKPLQIDRTLKRHQILITNLQKSVPEVEWPETVSICTQCLKRLKQVIAFRDLCISSYLKLKESPPSEVRLEQPPGGCIQGPEALPIDKEPEPIHVEKKQPEDVRKTGRNRSMCHVCGVSFVKRFLLERHLEIVHTTAKTFQCDMCRRTFASLMYLKAHKSFHSDLRPHICSFCGKSFKTSSDLYHHEQIHSNKRAYKCDICPQKAFNTSSDLYKHKMCLHMDPHLWKYQCNFCDKKFPLKSNLDSHIRRHTGERNFGCHLCERKWANSSLLKRHLKTHSSLRPFQCNLCAKSYKYAKSLRLHVVKMHGNGENL